MPKNNETKKKLNLFVGDRYLFPEQYMITTIY